MFSPTSTTRVSRDSGAVLCCVARRVGTPHCLAGMQLGASGDCSKHAPRLLGAPLNSSCGESEYFNVRRGTTGQHTTQAQSPASGETAWKLRCRLKWPGARTTEAAIATVSARPAFLILSQFSKKRDARSRIAVSEKRDASSRFLKNVEPK